MSQNITYNHGGVADFAADVEARSSQLMAIHDDILQRTNAIADFFKAPQQHPFKRPRRRCCVVCRGWWRR